MLKLGAVGLLVLNFSHVILSRPSFLNRTNRPSTIVWPPEEEGMLDPEIESILQGFPGSIPASLANNENSSPNVDQSSSLVDISGREVPKTSQVFANPTKQDLTASMEQLPSQPNIQHPLTPRRFEWPGFDGSVPQVPGFMGDPREENLHPEIRFQPQDWQVDPSFSDLGHTQQSHTQDLPPSHQNELFSQPSSSEELEKQGPANEGRQPLRLDEYTPKPFLQDEVKSTHQYRPAPMPSRETELSRNIFDERAASPVHMSFGSRPQNSESQPNHHGASGFNPADVVMHKPRTQFERDSTTSPDMSMQNTEPYFQMGSTSPTDMSFQNSESASQVSHFQLPRIPYQSQKVPWYIPKRVNCRPVEKVVKVQQCEPYTVETCWEEAKQECNPQPVTNCKGTIDTRLEQVCFNVVDELCTLVETVESEKTEDSYQTQHCFFGHEAEVCGISYEVQKFDKDDYGCTTIDVLSCRQVPQYVHDVNCIDSVEFECKEDGYQPNTLLPEIKCEPNPTNNCYKIPRKVYTEVCEVVPRRHCEAFNNIRAMPIEKEVCKPYTKKACDFKIETSPKISKKFKYEQVCRPKSREICEHVETKTIAPDCETSERLSCKYVQWAHQCKYDPKHYCHLVDKVVEEEVCDTVYGFAY